MIVEFSQLETERLRIRRFRDDDLEAYFAIRNSPEVAAFEGEYTLERGRKLIESMQDKELGAPGWFQFALEEKSSGELIGDMAFNFIELPQTAEMGYSLAPSQWGKGLAFEAFIGLSPSPHKTIFVRNAYWIGISFGSRPDRSRVTG
jgi:RimJ/RimL family protein N-acetyltransferase